MIDPRRRRALLLGGLLIAVGVFTFRLVTREMEGRIAARIERAAAQMGVRIKYESLHVGLFPPFRMRGIVVEKTGQWSATIDSISARLKLRGKEGFRLGAWLTVDDCHVSLPANFEFQTRRSVWDVDPAGSMTLKAPVEGLTLTTKKTAAGTEADIRAVHFAVDQLGSLVLEGDATHDIGFVDGEAHFEARSKQDFQARWQFKALGGSTKGNVGSTPEEKEPRIGFSVAFENLDFARVFKALSIDATATNEPLGSLSGTMSANGVLSDPSTLLIAQDFKFTPPAIRPVAIARLRSDFTHEVTTSSGSKRLIRVGVGAPNFVPVGEVPARFIRALLIAEDSAFFSHPGVDFSELPKVIAINMAAGEAARGGSTITQQLAKNLFLTREKSLHRKLKELAFTFLIESALGKQRILEIYLNIIEWGPGLYGLRPAARHYFDKEPWDLTPKEIAFLVTLIPGPVKYQGSFADGELRRGFEVLVNNLLVKMRSIDVITDEQYEAAIAETLTFRGFAPEPAATPEASPSPSPSPSPEGSPTPPKIQ